MIVIAWTLAELQEMWKARHRRLERSRNRLSRDMILASRQNRLREAELCPPDERVEARRLAMGWEPPELAIY